jgi:hypothetical protein
LITWEVLKCGGGEGLRVQRTENVINVQVSRKVKDERHPTYNKKRSNADWIGHILRRNCLQNTSLKERQKK